MGAYSWHTCRHGCTQVIISNQGREFVNKVNEILFRVTGTEHRVSTAQTNGLVERYNQTLQRSLIKFTNDKQDNWDDLIDSVLFAYRYGILPQVIIINCVFLRI